MATPIQWTDDTFNCITGCTRVSEGCRNCYAEKLSATRLRLTPKYKGVAENSQAGPKWTGQIRLHPELLAEPLRWRPKPSKKNPGGKWMVFVNDMSDTFHPDVPFEFLDQLYAMFACTPWITWQVLTKRPERRREYFSDGEYRVRAELGRRIAAAAERKGLKIQLVTEPGALINWPLPNVWEGTSIEDQATADQRIPELLATPAAVRFVSYEPALGPVDFRGRPGGDRSICCQCGMKHGADRKSFDHPHHRGLDWVIVGGESGPKARPFELRWARSTIEQCKASSVSCFVKQIGANPKVGASEVLVEDPHGGDPIEWPDGLRVRQWPKAAHEAS